MIFAIETWDPAYGSSMQDPSLEPTSQIVDATVELPGSQWRPLTPSDADPPSSIAFVDGVRRIDARVWINEPDGRSRPGVCASVAAGAVHCRPGEAEVGEVVVERGLYTASEHADSDISLADLGGHYQLRPVGDDSDDALYLGVHRHMTEIEANLATGFSEAVAASGRQPELVVFDGPRGRR
ncbi:MAG: hypothetical protein OER95_07705, partial [Acidimicrobiia bacterium]|nr:hypothetical protein [Acidimicrobiia bacterium]